MWLTEVKEKISTNLISNFIKKCDKLSGRSVEEHIIKENRINSEKKVKQNKKCISAT